MDCFEILGLRRRLVLGDEEIRAAYDTRCRDLHPDAGGEAEGFREVQEAYGVLQRTGRRLRHWLELETGGFDPRGEAPGELMDLFGDLGALLGRLEELARRKAGAQSALAKSMAEREGVLALGEVEEMQERVRRLEDGFTGRFAEFEAAGAEACRPEAEPVARGLAFLEKWDGQLREAAFAMVSGS